MKSWMDFQDVHLSDLPGCTYFAAANALRQAAQEFCRRAQVWRVTLDPVTTVANTSVYDFDITSQFEIIKLNSAKLNGQRINILLEEPMASEAGILLRSQREFELFPVPAAGLSLVLNCLLQPAESATGIEDYLYAAHARAIATGAKAMLMAMNGRPYSNPAEAVKKEAQFNEAIAAARLRSAKAYSSAPLRAQGSFL